MGDWSIDGWEGVYYDTMEYLERKKALLKAGKIRGDWSVNGWKWFYYDTIGT